MSWGRDISVVGVTYESQDVIGGWLASVRVHLPDAEIIVIDNSPGTRTRDAAGSAEDVVWVTTGENLGFARGCNRGAELATRRLVMFLNPDARLEDVREAAASAELQAAPFGLLVPGMRHGTDRGHEVYRHRGAGGEFLTHVVGPLWPRALPRPPWRVRAGRDWASGAALIVDRLEFLGLGGFDAGYFLLYEDRDLSARIAEAGLPFRMSDAFTVVHEIGTSSAEPLLDARRRCWAVLSWIEYRAAYSGQDAGDASYRRLRRALWLSGRLGGAIRRVGLGRSLLASKLQEGGAVARCLDGGAGLFERGYYPRARKAIERHPRSDR